MFGNTTEGTVENIVFRENPEEPIPVTFRSMDFYFRKDPSIYKDPADRSFKVTLDVGIIDPQYKRETFFNWPDQGVIGLAPT